MWNYLEQLAKQIMFLFETNDKFYSLYSSLICSILNKMSGFLVTKEKIMYLLYANKSCHCKSEKNLANP